MLTLSIESASLGTSLDLGALLDGTEGVQAVAGLTGAGLPPVSVQWSEGAGDGATYRGTRVLPRDVDIPIFVAGNDRDGLRAVVKQLAMILASEATLRFTDTGGDEWTLDVVRVGGGDFIYGVDTTGELDLEMVITLRAGQPFWTSAVADEYVVRFPTDDPINFVPYNDGSVDTPPTWEIRGPGKNLVIAGNGGVLAWNGTLANGETLFIDSMKGTVVDQSGSNRYANLAPSPRFRKVKAMSMDAWDITYPNADAGLARTNLCTNPNGYVNAANWSASGAVTTIPGGGFRITHPGGGGVVITDTITTPVTPGAVITGSVSFKDATSGTLYLQWKDSLGAILYSASSPSVPSPTRISLTAIAPANAASVAIIIRLGAGNSKQSPYDVTEFSEVMLEEATSSGTYFDGNTTDTATNVYAWTGTVGNSTSTLSLTPDRSTSQVICRINPRDWMVV